MKIKNLTPHPITIETSGGFAGTVTLQTDGTAPRLTVSREPLSDIGGIPIVRSTMGAPEGLPEQTEGVLLIVSALVAEHPSVRHRVDLAYPGEAVRDDEGRIIGCRGLCAGPGLAKWMRTYEGLPGETLYELAGEREIKLLRSLANDDERESAKLLIRNFSRDPENAYWAADMADLMARSGYRPAIDSRALKRLAEGAATTQARCAYYAILWMIHSDGIEETVRYLGGHAEPAM